MEPVLSVPLIEQNVNSRVWADGKTVGQTQNAAPVVFKLKDPHLSPPSPISTLTYLHIKKTVHTKA